MAEDKKVDDSNWEIVSVPVQTEPMLHNKKTDEVLSDKHFQLKVIELLESINKRLG
jgi:hypothetical protein